MNETWVIYKAADPNAQGWETRSLSNGGLTQILAEEHDWAGQLPQVGDRIRDYENLSDPGNGVSHGKDGDWVVAEVQEFSNPASPIKILVCLCNYQPIESPWEELDRGAPLTQQRIILPQLEMDLACMDHAHGAAEIGVIPFPLVTIDLYAHPRLHGTQNRAVRASPDVRGWIKDNR